VSRWTPKLGRHFIYTRVGIEYCRERVRQLLHALGFRLRRLRHRHPQATPAEQAPFMAELATLLAEWPEEREVLFVDEATVRRHPTLAAPWCLVDDSPEVPTGDDHPKIHVYGAVAPLTGRTHYHISHVLGKEAFAKFVRHLLAYSRETRLLVIHDRAEPHKGPPVEAICRDAEERLVLTPPPAYSPELNPEERSWKWRRRVVTHNHWFATLQEEIHALRDFFCYLAGRTEEVRRLCAFKIPESLVALL
jgi:transposase